MNYNLIDVYCNVCDAEWQTTPEAIGLYAAGKTAMCETCGAVLGLDVVILTDTTSRGKRFEPNPIVAIA